MPLAYTQTHKQNAGYPTPSREGPPCAHRPCMRPRMNAAEPMSMGGKKVQEDAGRGGGEHQVRSITS